VHDRVVERREAFPEDADVLYVPPPGYLQAMSLGYREALADLLWIQAVIFAGAHIGEGELPAITRYVDAITGLSPRFHRVYTWGGVTAIYGGSALITRPMVDQAIDMYRRGLAQYPESHALLYPLGMLLTNQVGSTPGYTDEEKAAMRAEGIELIRRAAAFGADPLVRQYAATLVADNATSRLAVQFLQSQLAQTEDEDYRRMLRKKLSEHGAEASAAQVQAIGDAFAREHFEQAPYVPDGVWAIIRPEYAESPNPGPSPSP
jgi:hypothetical protein